MWYFNLVLGVHLLLCLALMFLVLIQQGKGADVGAAFGGGSNTVFGAGGATNLLIKITTTVAILFMGTSILLVKAYSGFSRSSVMEDTSLSGSVMEGQPAEKEVPEPPAANAPADGSAANEASGSAQQ